MKKRTKRLEPVWVHREMHEIGVTLTCLATGSEPVKAFLKGKARDSFDR